MRVDYVVLSPGPAMDVAPFISIENGRSRPRNLFYLTTIYSDMDATVGKLVQAQFSQDYQVLPKREVVPPTMSTEEYMELIMEMMDESKTVAKISALRYLGYDVDTTGEGAVVQELMAGTMAQGILEVGDVVLEAQGQRIQMATDLVNLVRREQPGATVSLRVQRGEDVFETGVRTKESDSEPGIAVIGILIKTYRFGHNLPVSVDIDSENIGGPSAGLVFALAIVDALDKDGLGLGRRIAGTGTISLDGSVGPVGGVAQKVVGAEEVGAECFLVPTANAEEARRVARRIQVVPVDTLEDAASHIKSLGRSADGVDRTTFFGHPAIPLLPAA